MKGYPLRIDEIDSVEDHQTVGCAVEESNISNGQLFVESRPNRNEVVAPIFQLINNVRQKTNASLVLYQARMVVVKEKEK